MDERVMSVVEKQYPECKVVDVERAVVLVPPADGRYGTLALELPLRMPTTSYRDEQLFCSEVITKMHDMTRALPDIGKQTLGVVDVRQQMRGTVWEQAHLEAFLRFGILLDTEERVKPYYAERQVLKIVPPEYATDMQMILRTRSNEDLETLMGLLQQSGDYECGHWSYSYARVRGFNHIFWTMKVAGQLVAVRDEMEEYWQLVNGPGSGGQLQRKYINAWLAGVDFR